MLINFSMPYFSLSTLQHSKMWCHFSSEFFFPNARKKSPMAFHFFSSCTTIILNYGVYVSFELIQGEIFVRWKNCLLKKWEKFQIFHRLDIYSNRTTLNRDTNWGFPLWYACKSGKASRSFQLMTVESWMLLPFMISTFPFDAARYAIIKHPYNHLHSPHVRFTYIV